ncbi:MAG: hypothetical protein JOZ85_07105 [Betaproteobacteria bacterium]|nr:hypothetical protein [Betaproteobacteria bacterium]
MTETTFRTLERLYTSPRNEGVIHWHVAQTLERLGLVAISKAPIRIPPHWGPAKRLATLTDAGRKLCRKRQEQQLVRRDARTRSTASAPAITPAFLFAIRNS